MLRSLAAEYLAPISATNGQVGGFLRTDVAPLLVGNERPVFYLGDLDLSGDQIEQNTQVIATRRQSISRPEQCKPRRLGPTAWQLPEVLSDELRATAFRSSQR